MSFLWISLSVLTQSRDLTVNRVNSLFLRGPITQEMKVHCVRPQLSSDKKPESVSARLGAGDFVDSFPPFVSTLLLLLLILLCVLCEEMSSAESNSFLELSSLRSGLFSSSNISWLRYFELMSAMSEIEL